MLPVERPEVHLGHAPTWGVHRQNLSLNQKTRSVDPPDSGIQEAHCFSHVFFGFGPFFKCGELYVHAINMAVGAESC
tara:strand:+ start:33170 stop:33400 length:231 start_codon:yes stop_codon:yes gene_type:complete